MTLPELSAAATQAVEVYSRELDITNADHIALWLDTSKPLDDAIPWLACRIVEAHEIEMAKLRNAYRTGQLVLREAVDLVGANTLPTEYARWLSSIEVDVRVHDLTADEVARLVAAVAPERDAVEGAVAGVVVRDQLMVELAYCRHADLPVSQTVDRLIAALNGGGDADG